MWEELVELQPAYLGLGTGEAAGKRGGHAVLSFACFMPGEGTKPPGYRPMDISIAWGAGSTGMGLGFKPQVH